MNVDCYVIFLFSFLLFPESTLNANFNSNNTLCLRAFIKRGRKTGKLSMHTTLPTLPSTSITWNLRWTITWRMPRLLAVYAGTAPGLIRPRVALLDIAGWCSRSPSSCWHTWYKCQTFVWLKWEAAEESVPLTPPLSCDIPSFFSRLQLGWLIIEQTESYKLRQNPCEI